MDLPVSSHFFLKLQWENGFSSQIASLHTCLIPLELKISLTDSFCLCGPSKVHCNLYLPVSWLSLRHGPTHSWCHPLHPHSTSYVHTMLIFHLHFIFFLHLDIHFHHIQPPLIPPLNFTAYNQIKMMTPSKDGFAVFKQDGNKCPILHHSELSTKIFHNFITGCLSYITNKEIAADKQMIKVITMLKGYIWEDWVSVH